MRLTKPRCDGMPLYNSKRGISRPSNRRWHPVPSPQSSVFGRFYLRPAIPALPINGRPPPLTCPRPHPVPFRWAPLLGELRQSCRLPLAITARHRQENDDLVLLSEVQLAATCIWSNRDRSAPFLVCSSAASPILATTPHRRRTTPLDGTPNSGLQILPNMTDDGSSLDVEKHGTDSARSDDDASTSSSHPSPTRLGADAPAKDRKSRSDPDDIAVDVPGPDLDLDLELARVRFSSTPSRSPRG